MEKAGITLFYDHPFYCRLFPARLSCCEGGSGMIWRFYRYFPEIAALFHIIKAKQTIYPGVKPGAVYLLNLLELEQASQPGDERVPQAISYDIESKNHQHNSHTGRK
jgi:hypothetical protein